MNVIQLKAGNNFFVIINYGIHTQVYMRKVFNLAFSEDKFSFSRLHVQKKMFWCLWECSWGRRVPCVAWKSKLINRSKGSNLPATKFCVVYLLHIYIWNNDDVKCKHAKCDRHVPNCYNEITISWGGGPNLLERRCHTHCLSPQAPSVIAKLCSKNLIQFWLRHSNSMRAKPFFLNLWNLQSLKAWSTKQWHPFLT